MRIILAPMEGVVDSLMRDILTRVGGYDLCVTEFVRVVDKLLPPRVFTRIASELEQGGYTPSGTPVRIQLLGNQADALAQNAVRAVAMGSHGVDLNFGCPAKTVNKSCGGAVLLQYPEQIYQIIAAVRAAVPAEYPVTAKMRLGFNDTSLALENAHAVQAAGANELTIHARTKRDGYQPPAYWPWIAKIKAELTIPIIANGEIWSAADAQLCQQQANCQDIMLGRGALAVPNLAQTIRTGTEVMTWPEVAQLLLEYALQERQGLKAKHFGNRLKQWLKYIRLMYPEGEQFFQMIRTYQCDDEIYRALEAQLR